MIHWCGKTNLYALDIPLHGFDHVAVMVAPVEYGQWQNAGVEIVGCNENGVVPGDRMESLWQSYMVTSHAAALEQLGYQVQA